MGEQKTRMLRGELYLAGDPELVADRRYCRELLDQINAPGNVDEGCPGSLLHELLDKYSGSTEIRAPFYCDYGYNIEIGERCFVNFNAVLLDCGRITIGDDVQFGPGVQLLTATHPLDARQRREGWEYARGISIGSGAWLGGGVIVCPGVSIGTDSVVGAGSVVTRDVPDGVVAFGNPCRVIRDLERFDQQGEH